MFVNVNTKQVLDFEAIKKHETLITFGPGIDIAFLSSIGYEVIDIKPTPSNIPRGTNYMRAEPALVNGSWVWDWTLEPVETGISDTTQLDAIKENLRAQLLRELATHRYNVEVGGITVNGVAFSTTRDEQLMIAKAALSATIDNTINVHWKAARGWVELSASDLVDLGKQVSGHVQAAFAKEKQLFDTISALATIADVRNFDIEANWNGVI